ncbi:hypothetical protein ACWV95_34295 [Streptomyces albus]
MKTREAVCPDYRAALAAHRAVTPSAADRPGHGGGCRTADVLDARTQRRAFQEPDGVRRRAGLVRAEHVPSAAAMPR